MISVDTECTGIDFAFGAAPFCVTIGNENGTVDNYTWDVDPLTREVLYDKTDLLEIKGRLSTEHLVFQNGKFDIKALARAGVHFDPWGGIDDTLIAGHLLSSNTAHDLTSMVMTYLNIRIQPLEDVLEECVKACRRLARSRYPKWRISKKDQEEMPSAKEETWRFDYWLPKAIAVAEGYQVPSEGCRHQWSFAAPECKECGGYLYWNVTKDYSNADASATLALWKVMKEELLRRGLWEHYQEGLKVQKVLYGMETYGVTFNMGRLNELSSRYLEGSQEAEAICTGIAASYGYDLKLPKGGTNKSLEGFCFGEKIEDRNVYSTALSTREYTPTVERILNELVKSRDRYSLPILADALEESGFCVQETLEFYRSRGRGFNVLVILTPRLSYTIELSSKIDYINLPVVELTDGGKPSLKATVMDEWLARFAKNSREYIFVSNMRGKRKRDTAITFMESYRKFGVKELGEKWYRMYPGINQTATHTLRMGSYNPNGQQISKKPVDEDEDYTLRYIFGPLPGRVWYAMDYENIELRIPAYLSGEEKMIELFERPNDPPYFGSYHLLNASVVYPDLFAPFTNDKGGFKKKYPSTWYQWCKNGGFAIQYGCQKAKADATFHKDGAFELLKSKLPKIAKLTTDTIRFAEKHGYIETVPDRTVNPKRGYPLICQRTEWGKILPTIPLSYLVQGTAMWCTRKALVRCNNQLEEWNSEGYDGHIVLCPHDEIVFDLPISEDNTSRVQRLKELMEESGRDIGIPLTVSVSHCPVSWGD